MPALTWLTHHRLWILGLGLTALVVLAGAAVWLFLIRSPGTQIDLRQALRLYRNQQAGSADPDPNLPAPGVYRYRTSGGEQLSIGNISRRFPSATQMVVTDRGCATITWYPLEQHTEGLVVCPGRSTMAMTSTRTVEEIAGTRAVDEFRCPTDPSFVPAGARAGERWQATCAGTGERVALTGQVVGMSGVRVGGLTVPAVHTRISLSFSGSESGTNPTDYWLSPTNGLILRERETVDMRQGNGPLGAVRYHEQVELRIDSTTPAR